MLGSPGASTLALPKSHSFSTWLDVFTSRFCGQMEQLPSGHMASITRHPVRSVALLLQPARRITKPPGNVKYTSRFCGQVEQLPSGHMVLIT